MNVRTGSSIYVITTLQPCLIYLAKNSLGVISGEGWARSAIQYGNPDCQASKGVAKHNTALHPGVYWNQNPIFRLLGPQRPPGFINMVRWMCMQVGTGDGSIIIYHIYFSLIALQVVQLASCLCPQIFLIVVMVGFKLLQLKPFTVEITLMLAGKCFEFSINFSFTK